MDVSIHPNIGEVFTPSYWAQFAAQTSGIYQAWLDGASVLDPFMGEGALLLALIDLAIKDNIPVAEIPIHRLFGFDWQVMHINTFKRFIEDRQLTFIAENFMVTDTFFCHKELTIDILFTNPPWITFGSLSPERQAQLKPLFIHYDLVNTSSFIMGGSHVDLSALALAVSLDRWPPQKRQLLAFIPHSLLTSAAHAPWRNFIPRNSPILQPQWYYNLSNLKVFPISCDYGLLYMTENPPSRHYYKKPVTANHWREQPWPNTQITPEPFPLKPQQRPRQGINTSGANSCFIFQHYQVIDDEHVQVSNVHHEVILPKALVHPLLTAKNFKEDHFEPYRWIFLPYHPEDGQILSQKELEHNYPSAYTYLLRVKEQLTSRKGIMLKSYMKRADFYVLLGVNSYTFAPYKVVWQAMGSYIMRPIIVTRDIHANQALHAYIPAYSLEEAQAIQAFLESYPVQDYFHAFDVAGSKSFAQPHRLLALFDFTQNS
ncbi:hypothetical protein [Entomospira culicis]|uniref:Site-specific DNA-methyltransferase (adenine-specific) n=1 Tax=Entomospira culicis TaxID=2719989 RepID=A0A968GE42_9SPIO|nr:hypothetical protein [Entomospira culicis]NIZ18638.1 hypothetical protein [Entomospira culicis]NIZ68853.1 hypothetical protein [Entomospira culicis]WDI37447.1 hypothetical protein PVA46_01265 [Entomospira culicis]WDI39075.1 hypothetical protein PVA47_01270 [Entomospira culicis]